MPYIGKKPADIIATVIDTTTGTFSGEVDAGSLDVSGNADIDGITNLDNTDIDGTLDVSGAVTVGDGAVGTPAISFASDTNTGIYRGGTDILKFVTAGTDAITIDASQQVGIGVSPTHALTVQYNAQTTTAKFQNTNTSGTAIDSATLTLLSASRDASVSITSNSSRGSYLNFGDEVNAARGRLIYDNADDSLEIQTAALQRVNISSGGDISFYEDTGTTPKLFWDASAETLGIGLANPTSELTIGGNAITTYTPTVSISDTTSGATMTMRGQSPIIFFDCTSSGVGKILTDGQGLEIKDGTLDSQGNVDFKIDSSGNVGIGTTPSYKLHVKGSGSGYVRVDNTVAGNSGDVRVSLAKNGTKFGEIGQYSSSDFVISSETSLGFMTNSQNFSNGTRAVTIDTSGNLLVGKTSTAAGAGAELRADGQIVAYRSNNRVAYLDRLSSDGDIVTFLKDSGTVGSIGVQGDRLTIGNDAVGLRFHGSNGDIYPWNISTNALNDGGIDLGSSGARFKDLYLSGGAYIGGTGSANYLDDYEEGSWTPALSSGNSSTYDNRHGRYTKVGRLVTAHFTLEIGNTFAGGTAQYLIGGLPFNRSNEANSPSGSGIVHYFENIATTAHALTLRVDSGQSVMYITGAITADGATGLAVNANVLQAQANLYGSVFYYTN